MDGTGGDGGGLAWGEGWGSSAVVLCAVRLDTLLKPSGPDHMVEHCVWHSNELRVTAPPPGVGVLLNTWARTSGVDVSHMLSLEICGETEQVVGLSRQIPFADERLGRVLYEC